MSTIQTQPPAPQVDVQPQPQQPAKGAGMGTAAMVLGIIAVVLCLIPVINNVAIFLGLVGLVLGLVAWLGARKGRRAGKGKAMAGMILSAVAVVGVIASQALYLSALDSISKELDNTSSSASNATGGDPAAAIGTPVRDGAFEFTVTKVEKGVKSVGKGILAEKPQGHFVLVHVTVENIGDAAQFMSDSDQTVIDNAGRKFSSDSVAVMATGSNDVWLNEINPGNSVKGTLVYDMPKDASPTSIELHDSAFSDGVLVTLS